MNKSDRIILASSEINYLNQVLKTIYQGHYVFLLGATGMGKTTIIKDALDNLENHQGYSCNYFNYEIGEQQGAKSFYQKIVNAVAGKKVDLEWGANPSNLFPTYLKKYISQPTILAFDNLNSHNKEFYDKFSHDCRSVYNDKDLRKSKISKLLIIFGGYLKKSDKDDLSPLWNITDQIEILPIPNDEREDIISAHFEQFGLTHPLQRLVKRIDKATSGHHYLIVKLVEYFKESKLKKYQDVEHLNMIIDDFIDDILSLRKKESNSLNKKDQKLKKHFEGMIEYFETIPEVLQVAIDISENKIRGGPLFPKIDDITITGMITKDVAGNYAFSNEIYHKWFMKLVKGYRKADFCLFHADNDELYKKAKNIYLNLHNKEIRRSPSATLSLRYRQTDHLILKLINRLRYCTKLNEYAQEFRDMVSLIFNINKWGLFSINVHNKQIKEVDIYFKKSTYAWERDIKGAEIETIVPFINNVMDSLKPMVDWTGQWMAIPVIISANFARLFIASVKPMPKPFRRRWDQTLIRFIQESMTIYHYLETKTISEERQRLLEGQLENLSQKITGDKYRKRMDPLWRQSKEMLKEIGITGYTIYEHIDPYRKLPGGAFLKNDSVEDSWADRAQIVAYEDITDDLKQAIEFVCKAEDNTYFDELRSICYVKRKMASLNAVMVLELPALDKINFEKMKSQINAVLDLMKFSLDIGYELYQKEVDFHNYRDVMSASEDYMYTVDLNKQIIYANPKMEHWLQSRQVKNEEPIEMPCYYRIFGYTEKCIDCPIDKLTFASEPIRVVWDFELPHKKSHKIHTMEYTFVPIHANDQFSQKDVIAVMVSIHDLTNFQILWRALAILEEQDDINDIYRTIMVTLDSFGFKRVFMYKPDFHKEGRFISESMIGPVKKEAERLKFNSGIVKFDTVDEDLLIKGHVSAWYRRETPEDNKTRRVLEGRLGSSDEFKLKKSLSKSWDKYRRDRLRPNFWVSMPITNKDGEIIKLFAMDNHGDEEHDKEMITLDKLQILEMFGRSVGQVVENARQRDYLKRFQEMLCHGTMEPLSIMRMCIDFMVDANNASRREFLGNKTQAALGMIKASLGSLMTVKRGPGRIIKKEIDLKSFLKRQTSLFELYAAKAHQIKFNLILPDDPVRFNTDEVVLTQILNNLVGNSIKHFRKTQIEGEKKIIIELVYSGQHIFITLKDSGLGLPNEIKQYFDAPFEYGMRYPLGGLGLGFSREMADMLGGKLENISTKKGTVFKLTLQSR